LAEIITNKAESKTERADNSVLKKLLQNKGGFDYPLFFVVVITVIFGCVMVYSASHYNGLVHYGDRFFFLRKQIIGALIGLVCLFIVSYIDYNRLKKLKYTGFIVATVMLAMVFLPVIGVENYGARRWINLGFFTFQPSELAKFTFVLFAAVHMADHYKRVGTFLGILPVLITGGITCVLIILEPNLSITVVVGLTMLLMLFIGGAKARHFIIIALPLLVALPVLIVMEPYRINRMMAFINPWASPRGEGFQLIQSFYSLGSGGLFGVGLFNSRQTMLFLPFSESDFILSIIGEELGFVGIMFVFALFFIVILRGIRIALSAPCRFSSYLASGIVGVIALQALVNIAVVTGTIPPTGLPLPFISAGSSSLVVFMSAVGILLNIGRQARRRLPTANE